MMDMMDATFFADLLHKFGYLGIFLFLALGILGLPLPDEIMMTFLGYLTTLGTLNLYGAYFSALAGSVSGITLSYVIGKKLGYPFLIKYGNKFFVTRRRLRITQLLFQKYGNFLLAVAYFIPVVRHVTAYLAGISKLSFPRFALYAYGGAIIWCTTFIGLGHYLGKKWHIVTEVLHKYGLIAVLCFIPIAGGIAFYVWKKNKKTIQRLR